MLTNSFHSVHSDNQHYRWRRPNRTKSEWNVDQPSASALIEDASESMIADPSDASVKVNILRYSIAQMVNN